MAIHGTRSIGHSEEPSMNKVGAPWQVPEGQHFAVIVYSQEQVTISHDPNLKCIDKIKTFNILEHWVTTSQSVLEKFLEDLEDNKKIFVFFTVSAKGSITKKLEFKTTPAIGWMP